MSEQKSQKSLPAPWHVPVAVDDIAPTGQLFDLVADSGVRAAVARLVGLRDLSRFEGNFDVARHGTGGLHVTGRVSATVGQNCVVTLEPLDNEIEETVDLVFVPPPDRPPQAEEADAKPRDLKWNDPEPLLGGIVDLGALATEFLMLGIDPYPRKPGAIFEPPTARKPDGGPFAALAKLTKGREGS
jgi:uncharacterized protein DUF177 involved in 23S rRNA accumulation